jgi:hypothetical protein
MEIQAKKKHSELGIASILIDVCIILFFIIIMIITRLNSDFFFSVNMLFRIVLPFLLLAGLGLGIGGLKQKDRNKIFAIFGTIISALMLLVIFCCISGLVANFLTT